MSEAVGDEQRFALSRMVVQSLPQQTSVLLSPVCSMEVGSGIVMQRRCSFFMPKACMCARR
jgi:hypothetical protein